MDFMCFHQNSLTSRLNVNGLDNVILKLNNTKYERKLRLRFEKMLLLFISTGLASQVRILYAAQYLLSEYYG